MIIGGKRQRRFQNKNIEVNTANYFNVIYSQHDIKVTKLKGSEGGMMEYNFDIRKGEKVVAIGKVTRCSMRDALIYAFDQADL